MAIIEAQIKLLIKKNQKEYLETKVFAKISPVGRDEFAAAGQGGYKTAFQAEMWGFEYDNQTEIEYDGKHFVIYRTYGPKANGKIELYVGERIGKS